MPKFNNKEEYIKFRISILEASISSLLSCNITVTDLIMEKNELEKELKKINSIYKN